MEVMRAKSDNDNFEFEWASDISLRDICEHVAYTPLSLPVDKDGRVDKRYLYTESESNTLVNHLKTANFTKAAEFVDEFYQKRNVYSNYKRYFIYNVANTIINYLINTGTDADTMDKFVNNLFNSVNMAAFYTSIKQAIAVICEQNTPQPGNKLCVRVHSYIEKNYLDKNLSVSGIADALGLNYIYLSSSFKKFSGEGVLSYINKIRVSKSKFLLDNLDMSIEDVALAVGYSTLKTYVRVFKQMEGISPANFRNHIIKSELKKRNTQISE